MKKTNIRVRIPPNKVEEVIRLLEIVKGTEMGLVLDHRFMERVYCPLSSKCHRFKKYREIACKTCVPEPREAGDL